MGFQQRQAGRARSQYHPHNAVANQGRPKETISVNSRDRIQCVLKKEDKHTKSRQPRILELTLV